VKRKSRDEHLFDPGCKRVLALDGGGLRGVLTLSYLDKLESLLRDRYGGDPDFRLSDYFDLIGGTSTGAIIASFLAMGRSIAEIREGYRLLGSRVFRTMPWRIGMFSPKFEAGPLREVLFDELGDTTLGSNEIKTGLVVVSKRLDSGSVWPIHNNPRGKYFEAPEGDPHAKPNKDFLLRDVVRASCAAPHYFEPEAIEIAQDLHGAFIDGGVSPYNNPSLLLLMFAGLEGYGLNWPLAQDQLLIVSVGTGYMEARMTPDEVMKMTPALVALRSFSSVLYDCNVMAQTMLQWLAHTPTRRVIDTEIGSLANDSIGASKWATYLRYDAPIDSEWMRERLGIEVTPAETAEIFAMDRFENADILSRIGKEAARLELKAEHFPRQFDIETH
jgi:hypothetical protein